MGNSSIFWVKMVVDRIILILSKLSTQQKQLDFLQDLDYTIKKLQREVKLNGRLEGVNDRMKE